jgi:hypothetical protein
VTGQELGMTVINAGPRASAHNLRISTAAHRASRALHPAIFDSTFAVRRALARWNGLGLNAY